MVTLTATDSGGGRGSISFYVIVDDGNDAITDVDLIDDAGNVAVEADVDENDDSGVVFGEIRVSDQDHAMHPNGMHLIQILRGDTRSEAPNAPQDTRFEVKYDDAGIPWLALKAGASLDFEDRTSPGAVEITIRAVDMDGATNSRGTAFTGNVEFQTVSIVINNENDAPKANTIGNWWVTAAAGQDAEDVGKGAWLRFGLERPDDAKPAFTDPDGDPLTYSLSGPSWVEIDSRNGEITNTKGGVPVRGVHRLTVTATDPDGESASATFNLAVALSGDGTDANANNRNAMPRFGNTTERDYRENSGDRVVATFSIRDDDNSLGHHPFALDSVTITQIVVDFRDSGTTDETITVTAANQNADYVSAFRLSEPRKSGNTWTYDLLVKDTNSSPRVDTTAILDYETINRITVTVTATDGIDGADADSDPDTYTEQIAVDIDNVNDRPMAEGIGDNPATPAVETDFNIAAGTYGVSQSETLKEILYIKLEDIWNDQEDASNRLTFTASETGSWVSILHGPSEWGDIEGVTWNDTADATKTHVVVGDDAAAPEPGEQVLIIEIDRTGRNNDQGAMGSFTINATDPDGGTGSMTYRVTPTDQNLNPTNAVTLSGSAREDGTLRATFNDDRDPDLGGSATPVLVVYQWLRGTADDGTGATLFRQSTSNAYTPTQTDVGNYITVRVKYYEVFGNQIVGLDVATVSNQATTLRMVSDTPDKGVGSITVLADANVLSVTDVNVRITDGDYSTPGGLVADSGLTGLTVSWEMSDNGRGGWEAVDQTGDTDGTSTLELTDGKGKYYRAVVSYDADGVDDPAVDAADEEMESVYGDAIQVSDVRDTAGTAPTITGNPFPGGTLSVNVRNTSVQWQEQRGTDWVDIPGATGSLALTSAHAGKVIRALVSYHSTDDDNPGVTAIVAVAANGGTAIPGGTSGTANPVGVDDHDIEVSVAAPGHPARGTSNNAGHNLSHEEIVPLASLFQDPDTARLTYTVTSVTGSPSNSGTGSTYVYDDAAGGVLTFEASTGKLTFNSDVYQGHDGDGADGAGNIVTLQITASDGGGTPGTADVNLRINVAPKDIFFADSATGLSGAANGSGTPETFAISVEEHVGAEASPAPGGQLIAHVNVQDENMGSHKFGTHEVTLSGDDRFMLTHSSDATTGVLGRTDADRDGSTWEIRLKPGAKLDYEAENADGRPTIVLTLTATDGGGLSTPAAPITVTITVTNDTTDDVTPTPNDVPGLKDNDGDGTDDNDVVDGDDTDTDGGTPPPPGMSLGGIIEDFVDNMDTFEQDLLEDFMLVIDDGIDIA